MAAMIYKIDKGVPIPISSRWDDLFNRMQEGDSVLLSKLEAGYFMKYVRGYRHPSKVVSRAQLRTSAKVNPMFRVWLIKKARGR